MGIFELFRLDGAVALITGGGGGLGSAIGVHDATSINGHGRSCNRPLQSPGKATPNIASFSSMRRSRSSAAFSNSCFL